MSKKTRQNPEDLALPLGGADSHAHLDDEKFTEDLGSILDRAHKCGVAFIGNVFSCAAAWDKGKKLFLPHAPSPRIFFQLGIHPCEANLWSKAEEDAITKAVEADSNIKAIGEIGLDYYWEDQPRPLQKEVFAAQLKLAKKLNLPVSIHCRDAAEDTLAILDDNGFKGYPLLWHCFGADLPLAKAIIARGWHISIPGTVSFKKNISLREAIPALPIDKLHLETDCPYLAPEPWRGMRNEPAFVAFTAACVANVRQMPTPELWLACGANTKLLFGL